VISRASVFLLAAISFLPAGSAPAAYELDWADEFERDGRPDPRSWTYETGFVRNEELQWYQPENAWCERGRLIIEARRERRANPAYEQKGADWRTTRAHAEFTSASVTTRGLRQWRFGRFEMRAKIDTRAGLWPAFWTLGVKGRWPANGEIDIMEYYRGMLLANVAWASGDATRVKWDDTKKPIADLGDSTWADRFHVWRMDWNEHDVRLYLDDNLMNSTLLADTVNGDGSGTNPFHQAHYLILNLAIGGAQGGDPSATAFPARFEIDYVRVYRAAAANR
jgi:beta-glucanase (GH16 family)